METSSPRKIQFTMPLLDSHLDPEAAEQIRRRRPTPATLVASSDQSSPEIDEDRLLYKAALLNSPHQRRKGPKGTPTMKELQFLVEHHLYRQQQQAQGGAQGEECSSESCLSDRPSPEEQGGGGTDYDLPRDQEEPCWRGEGEEEEEEEDEDTAARAFEKLRCQMEEFSRESLSEVAAGVECPLSKEEVGCSTVPMAAASRQQTHTDADTPGSTVNPQAEEQMTNTKREK